MLKRDFPKSRWTVLLSDPMYEKNARFGVHIEDSIYAATYEAFKADRFDEVKANTELSATRFPLGANRDKFIFIGGLSKLNGGDADGCLADMQELISKYPESDVGEMAGIEVFLGYEMAEFVFGDDIGVFVALPLDVAYGLKREADLLANDRGGEPIEAGEMEGEGHIYRPGEGNLRCPHIAAVVNEVKVIGPELRIGGGKPFLEEGELVAVIPLEAEFV